MKMNIMNENSQGFTLLDEPTLHGDVKFDIIKSYCRTCYKRPSTSFPCFINTTQVDNNGQLYINGSDGLSSCFVTITDEYIYVDMATNGYIAFDYTQLYKFVDVKYNTPVTVKPGSNSINIKNPINIIYNGEPLDVRLYEEKKGKCYFNKDLPLTEYMYAVMSDGSYTIIESDVISKPIQVYLKRSYEGQPPLLDNIRASGIIPTITSDSKRKQTLALPVQHYTGPTTINFEICFLTEMEYGALSIKQNLLHELEEPEIKYNLYTVSVGDKLSFKPTTFFSAVKLHTIDDFIFTGYITRNVNNTKRENKGITRVAPTPLVYPIIINDVYYSKSATLKVGDKYSVYDEDTCTWNSYELRAPIMFNDSYIVNLVDDDEKEFNMTNIGDWSVGENVTITVNDKKVKNIYNISSDDIDKLLNVSFKFDDCEVCFTLTFQVSELTKTSLVIDDEEDFTTPYIRRASIYGSMTTFPSIDMWMYGRFLNKKNNSIHAYHSSVFLDSNNTCAPSTTTYPVISLDSDQKCTFIKTCPYIAKVLNEEEVITLNNDDVYLRINACSDVKFQNSEITVPQSTGPAYFFTKGTFYVFRSNLVKKLSNRNASFNEKPKPFVCFEEPQEVVTRSIVVTEKPKVVPEQPKVVSEQHKVVSKPIITTKQIVTVTKQQTVNTRSIVTKKPVVITSKVVTEQPKVVPEQPSVVPEQPSVVPEQPRVVPEQPRVVTIPVVTITRNIPVVKQYKFNHPEPYG